MDTSDRPMPYEEESERALLGALLLDPDQYFEVDLEPGEFYLERNATLFRAMGELLRTGGGLDTLTLTSYLAAHKQLEFCGGSGYLAQIVGSVPTAAFARRYAELIRRAHIKRQLLDASTQIAGLAYDAHAIETPDLKGQALAKLLAVDAPTKGVVIPLGDALANFMPQFEDYCAGKREVWGIPTGLDTDKYTGGLQPGDLWIVAGYPGKGKTSLALNISLETAKHGAVALFTLEMSIPKLMLRVCAEAGHVSAEDIRRGRITAAQRVHILEMIDEFAHRPVYLVEQGQSTDSIRARVAQLHAAGIDIKLVVIDYMRLLKDRAENELIKTANVSRAAKLLARDYNLTTILIHSLNRSSLHGGEGPNLQSLSYAGDYDADVVMITDFADNRPPTDKTASILIAKNRSGRTGKVPMVYLESETRWTNPAH